MQVRSITVVYTAIKLRTETKVRYTCTDSTPALLGNKSRFSAMMRHEILHLQVTHCFLHHHALASQTFLPKSKNLFDNSVKKHQLATGLCSKSPPAYVSLWRSWKWTYGLTFQHRRLLDLALESHNPLPRTARINQSFSGETSLRFWIEPNFGIFERHIHSYEWFKLFTSRIKYTRVQFPLTLNVCKDTLPLGVKRGNNFPVEISIVKRHFWLHTMCACTE